MTPLEDRLRAAIRAKAAEIRPDPPPLHLPARRRRSLLLAYGGGEKKGAQAWRAPPRWLAPAASAILVATVIAASALVFAGSRLSASSPGRPPVAHADLPPGPSSDLGVYAAGSPPGYAPIAAFAKAAGKQPNLVGDFSGWGEPFAASYAQTIRKHGAVMIVQVDPAGASVAGIAAGDYDSYLRSYADSVRDFGHPVVIGFGHEMNAPVYSWGYGHVPASTFVAAWRHIVTLFRGQGADNVTWLWTISADSPGTGPVAAWWPGADYVTWVGIDGFYLRRSATFRTVFGRAISQVRALSAKPLLVSDTAVRPGSGSYAKIANLFAGIRRYRLLGLVWLNEAEHQGSSDQDWRIQDDPAAEAAFRLGVSGLRLAHP
jgi:hypothetical protein